MVCSTSEESCWETGMRCLSSGPARLKGDLEGPAAGIAALQSWFVQTMHLHPGRGHERLPCPKCLSRADARRTLGIRAKGISAPCFRKRTCVRGVSIPSAHCQATHMWSRKHNRRSAIINRKIHTSGGTTLCPKEHTAPSGPDPVHGWHPEEV